MRSGAHEITILTRICGDETNLLAEIKWIIIGSIMRDDHFARCGLIFKNANQCRLERRRVTMNGHNDR